MLPFFLGFRRLMEKLGWWKSEKDIRKEFIAEYIKQYENKLKSQQDRLKDLKRTLESTQEEILFKEKERYSQTGKIREITEKEIGLLFKTFDSTSGMRDLIIRNIEALNTTILKLKELETVVESDLDSEVLEMLQADLEDAVKEFHMLNRDLTRLERTGYSSTNAVSQEELDAKLAQLHGETASVTPEKTPEPVLPQTEAPKKNEAPSNKEVSNLEAQLKAFHKKIELEASVESKSEKLEE